MTTDGVAAIRILEPIGVDGELEANGEVYYFCSVKCLSRFCRTKKLEGKDYDVGTSTDWIDETVCDECECPLEHTP